jgi:hypothetical protein
MYVGWSSTSDRKPSGMTVRISMVMGMRGRSGVLRRPRGCQRRACWSEHLTEEPGALIGDVVLVEMEDTLGALVCEVVRDVRLEIRARVPLHLDVQLHASFPDPPSGAPLSVTVRACNHT